MRLLFRATLLAAAIAAMPNIAGAAHGAFPEQRLAHKVRGAAAIQALGRQLPTVAQFYGMSAARLTDILTHDPNAWIDPTGRLYYDDEFPAIEITGADSGMPFTSPSTPVDLTKTFLLHSHAGSQRVIYLDFNGFSTSGGAWNGGAQIDAPAYDVDGNPASFSDDEKTRIQKIWQRVAEDYAPYDIDVTTEDPGSDAIIRTSATDALFGMRVVITSSSINVCSGCGGISYVGTFDYYGTAVPGAYQPAWVLYDKLGAGDEKYVAEAASHEVGHTLGLSHDGVVGGAAYYGGFGTDAATAWAPIMGVGYYMAVSQWSQGEYPSANNTEDDLAVMATQGVSFRTDDFGNTMATASQLAGTTANGITTVSQTGIIGSRTDQDWFVLSTGGGSLRLTVTPPLGSNLDAQIDLYDANGGLIASGNDPHSLIASISVSVQAGTYYVRIDGVGDPDPLPGYSDYDSMGNYTITGSFGAAAVPPTAVVSAAPSSGTAPLPVSFNGSGSTDSDGTIVGYAWTFGDGATSTAMNPSHTYNAGSFTASLTVTDSQGLKSTKTIAISATASTPPPATTVSISSISLVTSVTRTGSTCQANVGVVSSSGTVVSGATVTGRWSGNFTGSPSATTSSGMAIFKSAKVRAKTGTCGFGVTGVSLTGATYDASKNAVTSSSIRY